MTWYRAPTIVIIPGVILYSIIQIMIFFWISLSDEHGAGLFINENITPFSTNDRIIAIIFQLYVSSLFVYGILKIHLNTPYPRLRRAYTIMMMISLMLFTSRIIRFMQYFGVLQYDLIELIGTIVLLSGFAFVSYVYWIYPEAILLTNVQLSAILVISSKGTPITAIKFLSDEITANPTLLAGVISAIQSLIGSIEKISSGIQEIQALNRSMLLHERENITFTILTDSNPTKILRSSLVYFARNYISHNHELFKRTEMTGEMINQIEPVLSTSFPYMLGIPRKEWS
jgi:hypothetical protein